MSSTSTKFHFKVHGMDCAEEVAILKRELGPLLGGEESLSFDILKGRLTVTLDEGGADLETVVRAVAKTGMKAEAWEATGGDSVASGWWESRARTVLTAASGTALLVGLSLHLWAVGGVSGVLGVKAADSGHSIPLIVRGIYLLGILAAGWHIFPKAWFSFRRARPDMNLLMTVAVAGAVGIGEWFEAATVAFLFALSLALESWSVGRARRAVEALLDLAAPIAHVLGPDGVETDWAPDQVAVGSRVVVRPGERIPLDGRVVTGSSEVDQAPITGESRPVPKKAEAEVFAGTINGDGALEIETTRTSDNTTLAHIIKLVGEAQARRAPSEQWVEKFARVYTPAIIGLAVLVLIVPPLTVGAAWPEWLYRALVLLVIGCPCALVISTPVSIVAALAAAARKGALVKGGVYIEVPARLDAVAFDKTGTLTKGQPSVVRVIALNGHDESDVLRRAAAMELRSNHPLGRAIVQHAENLGLSVRPAEAFQSLKGKGATARVDGKQYWLGSHRYLEERGQETPDVHRLLEELSESGHTVVAIGNESHVCGLIALADTVRKEARSTVEKLRDAGIAHIVMLTGDNKGTARSIGRIVGVDEVQGELLPADKVLAVERLASRYAHVAMVGDGVNDAPALARASLGIAMGAAGSDAAIETADIALMSDDLSTIPWLIQHSKRTLRIIRQNITLSIAIKVVFVVLTFLGYASLWAAIAADMGVSLLVIFNALSLLKG